MGNRAEVGHSRLQARCDWFSIPRRTLPVENVMNVEEINHSAGGPCQEDPFAAHILLMR